MTRFIILAFPEPSDPVWASLDRYLAGVATPVDLTEVERWCAGNAERRACVDAWREAWGRLSPGERTAPDALQRIADQIMAPRAGRPAKARAIGGGKRSGLGMQTLRGWGVSLGTIIGALLAFIILKPTTPADVGTTRTYVTRDDQQAQVTLSDGTRVTLGAHTVLRLVRFGTQSRTVSLDGEAYFNVASSSSAPFLVQTGNMTTRVLGTAFLIRHDSGSSHVRVAVADGKVRVITPSRIDSAVTLTAGQIGELSDSTKSVSTMDDLAPGTERVQDELVFYHTPVVQVLATLRRWYGYQFRCPDSTLADRSVTIVVSMQSSTAALAALEQILNVSLTVVGDTVTLTPQLTRRVKGVPRAKAYDVWTPTREVGR